MTFGDRMRYLLRERGMSQKELAQELFMAESTLSGYIREVRQPSHQTLIRFAEYFGVTTDYLLGVTDYPYRAEELLAAEGGRRRGVYRHSEQDKRDLLTEQNQLYQKPEKGKEGRPLRRTRPTEGKRLHTNKKEVE